MKFKRVLVTGIGTEVGKTLVCAALCNRFDMDYYKPVQCGSLDQSDSIKVKHFSPKTVVHKESHRLVNPLSPHHAAEIENVRINPSSIEMPETENGLVIEGAGGLMVPLNSGGYTYADYAVDYDLPIILVSRNYLGSINHTLLTIEVIRNHGLKLAGIIISGEKYRQGEDVYTLKGTPIIGRLEELQNEDELHKKFKWYGLD